MNAASKTIDESLSDFQTGIGATAHATLDTRQLVSYTRNALDYTVASMQCFDGGMIATSEVHELLIKIHDILDNAVSKLVGYTVHILTYL